MPVQYNSIPVDGNPDETECRRVLCHSRRLTNACVHAGTICWRQRGSIITTVGVATHSTATTPSCGTSSSTASVSGYRCASLFSPVCCAAFMTTRDVHIILQLSHRVTLNSWCCSDMYDPTILHCACSTSDVHASSKGKLNVCVSDKSQTSAPYYTSHRSSLQNTIHWCWTFKNNNKKNVAMYLTVSIIVLTATGRLGYAGVSH